MGTVRAEALAEHANGTAHLRQSLSSSQPVILKGTGNTAGRKTKFYINFTFFGSGLGAQPLKCHSLGFLLRTDVHTYTRVLTPGSSLRGKNAAFSLLSISTMISDSLHSCSLRSAASHTGLSQGTRTSSMIHSTGPALYSLGRRKSGQMVPRKEMSAHVRYVHTSSPLSITVSVR